MDYCHTGKSLDGAYTVLTSDQLLGNTKKNITTASRATANSSVLSMAKIIVTRLTLLYFSTKFLIPIKFIIVQINLN